jgi:hypothetical protein
LGTLILKKYRDVNNADFKLKRAKAAIGIRDVETSPILAGLSPAQLKVWIVAGLVVAGILFFA